MTDNLARYFEILKLQPGASKDEINTAYYAILERLPESPTEEEAARIQQIKHAWSILQRNYRPAAPRRVIARKRRSLVPMLGLTALVLGIVFFALNYQNIRLAVVEYHPGDVVRWSNKSEPYGKLLRYDPMHRFHTGEPSPAYEIRLEGEDETIWLSERIVIKAMVPMDSGELQAAGIGGN
jgi:hypothetical protein